MENYWHFSGEIVRIKELSAYDAGATLLIKSIAQRNNYESSQIVEFPITVPPDMYEALRQEGLRNFSVVEAEGHFETWTKGSDVNIRTRVEHYVDQMRILKV